MHNLKVQKKYGNFYKLTCAQVMGKFILYVFIYILFLLEVLRKEFVLFSYFMNKVHITQLSK